MVTKMKKKCSSVSKDSGKKGQFLVVGTTIKIVLIVLVLVVGMSILATQKGKIAEISDSFMKLLAQLGFLHLSDDDAIALASMQATACAVDVVAKYSAGGLPTDGDIFAGIESCEANLFDDSACGGGFGFGGGRSGGGGFGGSWPDDGSSSGGDGSSSCGVDGGGVVVVDPSAGTGSGSGGTGGSTPPVVIPPAIGTALSRPTMTVTRGNVFICNSVEYTVTISNVIYDSIASKADFTVVSNSPSSNTETFIKGTGYWPVGDIHIRLNDVSSSFSVSGKLKCNGYSTDYSGTIGTFDFLNSWVG